MERAMSSVWKKRGATKLFRRHGTWGARWASSLPSMMSANETTTPVGFPSYIVWGANTGVGKTLVSAGLAAGAAREGQSFAFIKPVQTGFPKDIDARLVAHAHGKCRILYGDHAAEILDAPESPRVSRVWKTNMKAQDVESRSHSITLFAWREAVSPHVAMEREGRIVSDRDVVQHVAQQLMETFLPRPDVNADVSTHAPQRSHIALIETAGGVCSPSPAGSPQCDVLRSLWLPGILVGDGRLGGISSTLSSYDALRMRGYDVPFIIVSDEGFGNTEAIRSNVNRETRVFSIPKLPPPFLSESEEGASKAKMGIVDEVGDVMPNEAIDPYMKEWLFMSKLSFDDILVAIHEWHEQRIFELGSAKGRGQRVLWWPFTQHRSLDSQNISVIDARSGENFVVFADASDAPKVSTPELQSPAMPRLRQQYDACASWWTQGLTGQSQIQHMPRAIAAAAGRYGHVIFPEVVHAPALKVAERILDIAGADWASRVFFSDDGSTSVEVAIKMAFRKYIVDNKLPFDAFELPLEPTLSRQELRHGAEPKHTRPSRSIELGVMGIQGAYHGDTLGAMDAVAPGVFNGSRQTPWFTGRGTFLEPPTLAMSHGRWETRLPPEIAEHTESICFDALEEAFDFSARDSSMLVHGYRQYIHQKLSDYESARGGDVCQRVGACIIEPVLQGAGGMRLIDPLFQRTMVRICRDRGVPVIFDEVFTGLWRLGFPTGGSLLGVSPDVACYAKLLTGGTIPLAVTVATESVFNSFQGDSKAHTLLHGHSYTAHPIGCAAALHALDALSDPEVNTNLCTTVQCDGGCSRGGWYRDGKGAKARSTSSGRPSVGYPCLVPLWDDDAVKGLSRRRNVKGVVCIGTIVAVELSARDEGYASSAASGVVQQLRERHNVYARPLGNVVYMMVTPMTSREQCSKLVEKLEEAIEEQT